MAYEKLNLQDGVRFTAAHVAHLEQGIEDMAGKDGTNGTNGKDGVSPVVSVSKSGTVTTLTIVDASGTKTAKINDGADGAAGEDGYTPVKGVDYFDGKDGSPGAAGKDGVSPTVTATKSGKVTTLTIVDASGTKTATINDGTDGTNGTDGDDGVGIANLYQKTYSLDDGGENIFVVELTDGTSVNFKVRNGRQGSQGEPGEDGQDGNGIKSAVLNADYTLTLTFDDGTSYTTPSIRGATGEAGTTPVKGTDYFTEADKAEMVEDVKNSIDGLDELIGSGKEDTTYTPSLAGYVSVETGTLNTTDFAGQVYHTDYISLDGYASIYAQYKLSSIGYAIAFFDGAKTLLANISIKGAGASGFNTVDMDVPSGAAYCMLSCYQYSGAVQSYITLKAVKGLAQRMDKLEEDVANFVATSPLHGKTIAVLGDSISSVAYTVPNYWQLIAEKTGCNFLDYGVSGSCFAVRSAEHTPSFLERAADMSTSAEAVLVMGGTNDAGKDILLGEWDSTDNTTLYGALNALIALLRSKYPGRPIVFCTPIKRKYDIDGGFPPTMADLAEAAASTNLELWHCALAIQAKCAVHGIPVIDLYNASGIGSGLADFFRDDDSLHPSAIGECRIANAVQPVLEQQFLHVTEYPEAIVNLVPLSIDTDGSIFNTTGYKDGYRLSSSGSTSAQAGCTVTGFIPYSTSDILRIKGVTMTDADAAGTYRYNAYICFYDSSFALLGATSNGGNKGICGSTIDTYKTSEVDGVHTYDFSGLDGSSVKYIRISSPFGEAGSGSGMFVTVNQEIT